VGVRDGCRAHVCGAALQLAVTLWHASCSPCSPCSAAPRSAHRSSAPCASGTGSSVRPCWAAISVNTAAAVSPASLPAQQPPGRTRQQDAAQHSMV
jgi:hypothetical protein